MNIHTFKDAVSSKRSALINDMDDDEDEQEIGLMKRAVEGEEDATEAFNDMGEAIEPFNMRNEREGGHIDDNMNYVFQKDKGEVDAWVAGMDEVAMEKSIGEAAMALQKKLAKQEQEDAREAGRVRKTTVQLRREIVENLLPEETLPRAMNRLGVNSKVRGNTAFKRKTQLANKASTGEDNTASSGSIAENSKEQEVKNKRIMHLLTENADELLAAGLSDIYKLSREALDATLFQWEYEGADKVMYGPMSALQIAQWKAQGFLTGDTAVMMRKCAAVPDVSEVASRVGQKVKFQTSSSIYDDEDDLSEQPAAKRSKVGGDGAAATSAASAGPAAAPEFAKGPWVSSDDVEFVVTVDLEEYDEQQAILAARAKSGAGRGPPGKPVNALRGRANSSSDDEDEDDGLDDKERQRRSKRANKRFNRDADSDDEEED